MSTRGDAAQIRSPVAAGASPTSRALPGGGGCPSRAARATMAASPLPRRPARSPRRPRARGRWRPGRAGRAGQATPGRGRVRVRSRQRRHGPAPARTRGPTSRSSRAAPPPGAGCRPPATAGRPPPRPHRRRRARRGPARCAVAAPSAAYGPATTRPPGLTQGLGEHGRQRAAAVDEDAARGAARQHGVPVVVAPVGARQGVGVRPQGCPLGPGRAGRSSRWAGLSTVRAW